ncbi:MAG TPA: glycosyltransferase family 39 protein, partial [Isosphaeraceae bacterium]
MIESPSPRPAVAWAWIVGLASLMTLLNAAKPIHMDDAVYHMYAAQIAAHPGDPYGGEVVDYWFPPKTGMDVLAPVFLPYYWSRAIAMHGENVFLAKLWLAPFPLLLVGATWSLGRRFAAGYEAILACLVACSPAILPGQNFMLDVPALALGLAGLVVFIKGCDRGSWPQALAAGLLAGVAINTKWTGLLAPAAIGLYAVTHRRVGLGVIAIAASAAVFGGWEAWLALQYGRSHFLLHSEKKGSPPLMDRINGARALVSILGGVAPGVLVT